MDRIKESTKNFLVCGVLMLICGAALIMVSRTGLGVTALLFGAIFIIAGIASLIKDLRGSSGK